MRDIIIYVGETQVISVNDIGASANRIIDKHRIIKGRTIGRYPSKDQTTHYGLNGLMMKSAIVYNVTEKKFTKDRYNGTGGGTLYVSFPQPLANLFSAINDISDNKSFDELSETHTISVLYEAIYLTDTVHEYPIDNLTYQLVRLLYGREMTKETLKEIYKKFPEKLI